MNEKTRDPDQETRLKLYRAMLECRMMEQRAYDLYPQEPPASPAATKAWPKCSLTRHDNKCNYTLYYGINMILIGIPFCSQASRRLLKLA